MRCLNFFMLFIIIAIPVFSQELPGEKNRTDEKGLRQGYWERSYPGGKIQYRGTFINDRPVGEFTRYFPNGNTMAVMDFCSEGRRAETRLFHEDGTLAARGLYLDEKKDSIWHYFTPGESRLTSMETYEEGVKKGLSVIYYPNGVPSETFWYENSIKNGPWNQFYDSGRLKVSAGFKNGLRHGDFIYYTTEGKIEIKGGYRNNQMHGEWVYYDPEGQIISLVVYKEGRAENEDELLEMEQDIFKRIEEMRGKIPEPDESDMFFPGG
jgi:antitoxin component YwqK of YwqJK toxin-antitoxin module